MELNESNFDAAVLQSDELVMVDFWAEWCTPCKMMSPVMDKLVEAGYRVGKVNIDTDSKLALEYKVHSIPSFLFFKGGEVVHRLVGAQQERIFIETFDKLTKENEDE